jgi:signal transduction histidine kinase
VVLDEQPAQVRASLEAIRAASVQALQELRVVLDTVAPVHPDISTSPGADGAGRLAALVNRARGAGLPVDLHVTDEVPAELSGVVHDVVRESLTNFLRHAVPTQAVVTIGRDSDEVVVTVADRGRGATPADGDRSGTPTEGGRGGIPTEDDRSGTPTEDDRGRGGMPTEGGRGLPGMRDRVEAAGGILIAGPHEAGGFTVTARLPLPGGPR